MSFLDFFSKSPRLPIEVPPQPENVSKFLPKQNKTYGFCFKYYVNYTNHESKKGTYNWTSDLYLDYNQALVASRKIIKDINEIVKSASGDEPLFITDISLPKSAFISATASDPALLEFIDGVLSKAIDIGVYDGGNAVINQTEDGDSVTGKYKTMKNAIDF